MKFPSSRLPRLPGCEAPPQTGKSPAHSRDTAAQGLGISCLGSGNRLRGSVIPGTLIRLLKRFHD